MWDEYVRDEVIPFVHASCQTPGIPITTMGASLGAYHAANTLFRYPHLVKRCYGLSGIYDLRRFMDGQYDENFYYHNPLDYMANLKDPWYVEQLATCEIRLITGSGPFEESRHTYAFSGVLARRGIRHHVDDWGPKGGHDWPYWREMIRAYVGGW
jgi:esterase/lipase superfamily enzyme